MSEQEQADTEIPEEKEEKKELSNIEKYNLRKQIEKEIAEEKSQEKEEKQKAKQEDLWLKEAVEARKFNASPQILELIKDLDLENQLVVLKAHAERRAEPNRSSLPTPIAGEKDYLYDNYTIFNQNKETIEYSIPASELMNPTKNKRLLGIK